MSKLNVQPVLDQRFQEATSLPATRENIRTVQDALAIKDDGFNGYDTVTCAELEWVHRFGKPTAEFPAPDWRELVFYRRVYGPQTISQRNAKGEVRYECVCVYRDADGKVVVAPANTMPMQVESCASPRGHVAVVRPGGPWKAKRSTHKGYPALRIGTLPCWRNLSGYSVLTPEDKRTSEAMRPPAYPQCDDNGLYATGILIHPGPPQGFSIGCFTLPLEEMTAIHKLTPESGWQVRLVDLR